MDLYFVDLILSASVLTHISLLHVGMVAYIKDPYYGFHNHVVHTYKLHMSLPTAAPLGFILIILELGNIELTTS